MPSTNPPKPRPAALLFFRVVTFTVVLLLLGSVSPLRADTDSGTVIAYISSSTENNEIRLINPDGTQERSFWRTPSAVHSSQGIGTLSWHPKGTKLLFDSGHDWQRSLSIRDLYTVSSDGQRLRRITSPPSPEDYNNYPTGEVTFTLDASEQGDVQVYIVGASEPVSYFAKRGNSYQITQTVADFGKGVRQHIRLYDPEKYSSSCNYSEEGWIDVVPGKSTDFGRIHFPLFTSDAVCPYAFSPSWSYDGSQILYLRLEIGANGYFIHPPNNLWEISANPETNSFGKRILNMNEYVSRGHLYRAIMAPTAEQSDEMLFLEKGYLGTDDKIVSTTTTNADSQKNLSWATCNFCRILDAAWLPDGSGIIFARHDRHVSLSGTRNEGVLYHYSFATHELTEIINLPNEVIGKLAIAPDGRSIVFERGSSMEDTSSRVIFGEKVQCPCELWIVNSDGSGLRQLASDGRSPAWSQVALANEPTETEWPNPIPATDNPTNTKTPVLQKPEESGGGAIRPHELMLLLSLILITWIRSEMHSSYLSTRLMKQR